MSKNLSICVPTYNRAELLRENLLHLLPQLANQDEVEVIISDNFSTDKTGMVVEEFAAKSGAIHYYKNSQNLGYAGNQVKCFERATGAYIAILCDDDIYTAGMVDKILETVKRREYAFVALNYFSFREEVSKPHIINFAPDKDVVFNRAYDVLNYPSVGHFSGFVFNASSAKPVLAQMLTRRPLAYYEKHRGVISDLAVRTTLAAKLPAYFIGLRKLATRDPQEVDYNALRHNCLEYYEYYDEIYREGLLTPADLAYRRKLVLSWLPFAIAKDSYCLCNSEMQEITKRIHRYFANDPKFIWRIYPILLLGYFYPIRQLYRKLFNLKQVVRKIKGVFIWPVN